MEQNANVGAPVAPALSNKQKSGKGLKVVTAIACVVAICGVGFGVYGIMQSLQKDSQISNLKVQVENKDGTVTELKTDKIEINNNASTITVTDDAAIADNLYLIGSDEYTKRRYYLATANLDTNKDSREIEAYLIDMTKLGSKDGVKKYDLKTVLDKIANDKVASLPETLAAGTVNARPKSSCKSFKVTVFDPTESSDSYWKLEADWNSLLPLPVHMDCIINDGTVISQSLGADLYSLNPQTGETAKVSDNWR